MEQVSLSNYDTEVTRRSQVVVGADGSLVVMSSAEFLAAKQIHVIHCIQMVLDMVK